MPAKPQCDCKACASRRAAQARWHNKPEVKPKRLKANRDRRAAARGESVYSPEVSDEEMDRRAREMDRRQQCA